jgi:hypothetical protein
MQLQFEFNWIQIQLKRNKMQNGRKGIENLFVNMVYGNKILNTFPCFFTWEWDKHIIVWNYLSDTFNL